jgi:hypothetical protein
LKIKLKFYSVLAKKNAYASGKSNIPETNVDTTNDADVLSEMDSLNSKTEDYQKQIENNLSSIIDWYAKLYESQNKFYDKEVTQSNTELELLKAKYDLYEKDNNILNDSSREYMKQEWQEINNQYAILTQKEAFIKSQMSSNIYDEKTLVSMKEALQNVRLEEEKTQNQLHDSFKEWLADRLNVRTLDSKNNIENYNNQLSLLNEQDSGYSSGKVALNQQILEQQTQITNAIREQIDFTEQLFQKEEYGTTRTLWAEQIRQLNNQLIQAQTEVEKTKKALEDSVITSILNSVDQKLKLINEDLKDIESSEKDISDTNISQKLIDTTNILQNQITILPSETTCL